MPVQVVSEREPLLSNRQDHRKLSCCCSYKPRKFSSKAAVLVLVWQYAVVSVMSITGQYIYSDQLPDWINNTLQALALLVFVLTAVVSGWLADIRLGRSNVVQTGLVLTWIGMLLKITGHTLTESNDSPYITILSFTGVCIANIGTAAFLINALQFGLEQMPDASSDGITAFISWFIVATLGGIASNQILPKLLKCLHVYIVTNIKWLAVTNEIFFPLVSIAICSKFLFSHWFIDHRHNHNLFKTVYRVLKFAKQHKYPVNRSAFTYWEEEIPSRIDLGKTKYGGPFTTEEVEDVKTFFRILTLLGVLCIFFSVYIPTTVYLPLLRDSDQEDQCYYNLGDRTSTLFTAVAVLVHEYAVYPIIRKYVNVSTLKKIGFCLFLSLLCTVLSVIYMILKQYDQVDVLQTHPWIKITTGWIFFTLLSVLLTSFVQFVYAQAPESMKGIIIAIMWLSFSAVSLNTFIVSTNLYSNGKCSTSKHCEVYVMSALTLLSAVMFIIYCCVARWYKRRERDELYNDHAIIEEIYGRHVEHNETY